MAILKEAEKQPIEVEVYAIQFKKELTGTDTLTGGHQVISHHKKSVATLIKSAPYTVLASQSFYTIRTSSDLTLPVDTADGFTLYVGNVNQGAAITVDAFTVPARGSIILTCEDGIWTAEVTATGIVVSSTGDHRMRVTMSGGLDKKNYKIEMTALVSDGRVLQDEWLIKVRES